MCFVYTDYQAKIIERIRQTSEQREKNIQLIPDGYIFHLNKIFTRLQIVRKENMVETLTNETIDMTAIFRGHADCLTPRVVLIEGEPCAGKTTLCQKLAYDWATKLNHEWDKSFPKIDLMVFLKCRDIKSDIRKAIEDTIFPFDVDETVKEAFFTFIREHESKVMLVLDGLDEADPNRRAMYIDLLERRNFADCYIVLTSRHERHEFGSKVRSYCDTLWQIMGFTEDDAQCFTRKYFQSTRKEDWADKLKEKLWPSDSSCREYECLKDLTRNPYNTALICVLFEENKGTLPRNVTQLHNEIVRIVLRRYESKNKILSNGENLIEVYKDELTNIGRLALQSLRKGELYFELPLHEFRSQSFLTKCGFLSVQPGAIQSSGCGRCGFLNKRFQGFFSGLYIAFQILKGGSEELRYVVADQEFWKEFNQVLLFVSGIVASHCKETVVSLVERITKHLNTLASSSDVQPYFKFAFDFISEGTTYDNKSFGRRLVHTFGKHLDLANLQVDGFRHTGLFFEALSVNMSLTTLDLRSSGIGNDTASLSRALIVNTSLKSVIWANNNIDDVGVANLSEALKENSTLTSLDLSSNSIGDCGVLVLSEKLTANSSLTALNLRSNIIGDDGVAALLRTLTENSSLINLDLGENRIGTRGTASLSMALAERTSSLKYLHLDGNEI